MTEHLAAAVDALAVAATCFVLGYLVTYRGWVGLASAVPVVEGAEDVTATVVGTVLFAVGAALLAFAALLALGVGSVVPPWLVGLALVTPAVALAPRLGARVDAT
jgi:hypothetical protein